MVSQDQYERFVGSVRRDIDEHNSRTTQRLLLIEARTEERQNQASELAASLQNQLSGHTDNERLEATEHNLRDIQLQFATVLKRINELDTGTSEAISTLQRETAQSIAAAQRCDQVNQQLLETQRRFSARIEDLDQRLAVQHEAAQHWNRGFTESFAQELSTLHARLTDQCTGLAYQYETVARWQNTTDATLRTLELTVRELREAQPTPDPKLFNIAHRLHSLHRRIDAAEIRQAETAERLTSVIKESQQVIRTAVKEQVEEQLQGLAATIYDQFESHKTTINERLESLREVTERLAYDVDLAKQEYATVHNASGLCRMSQDEIDIKAQQLEAGVAQQIQSLREQHMRFASATTSAIDALRSDLTFRDQLAGEELQTEKFNGRLDSLSLDVHRVQEALLTRAAAIEQQHVADHDSATLAIRELHDEVTLFREELHERRADCDYSERLAQIENTINAKIETMRLYIEDAIERTGTGKAGVLGLSQSVDDTFDRLAALSGVEQAPSAVAATYPTLTTVAPTISPESDSFPGSRTVDSAATNTNAEQLEELQERMDAEIERVRAELKERKGRWKVRRSGA
jgi:hypothetical protein